MQNAITQQITPFDPVGSYRKGVDAQNAVISSKLGRAELEGRAQDTKLKELKTRFAAFGPIVEDAHKKYSELLKASGGNEATALSEFNSKYWPGYRDTAKGIASQIGTDPNEFKDVYDPRAASQFLQMRNSPQFGAGKNAMKQETFYGPDGKKYAGWVKDGVIDTKNAIQIPDKEENQSTKNINSMVKYFSDLKGYDFTPEQILVADKDARAVGAPIETILDDMMSKDPSRKRINMKKTVEEQSLPSSRAMRGNGEWPPKMGKGSATQQPKVIVNDAGVKAYLQPDGSYKDDKGNVYR